MRTLRPAFISALGLGFSLLFASSLLAQRVFVSAVTGNDANSCTRSSPCRSFATAIATVAAGGEVIVLDSGGYGPFTVSKAVSVETPAGIYAGVSATSGDGIDVSAGASDVVVVLRGLTLYGFSGAVNGINFSSGAALQVESCVVNGFPSTGIYESGNGNLFLTDTTVSNNLGGVRIQPSAFSNLVIDHCRFEGNSGVGLNVFDGVLASVRDSVASGNLGDGFRESGTGSRLAILNLANCLAANNFTVGIATANAGPGLLSVSGCTVTGNAVGLTRTAGHTFESFGDNHVRNNSANTSGTITSVPNI